MRQRAAANILQGQFKSQSILAYKPTKASSTACNAREFCLHVEIILLQKNVNVIIKGCHNYEKTISLKDNMTITGNMYLSFCVFDSLYMVQLMELIKMSFMICIKTDNIFKYGK